MPSSARRALSYTFSKNPAPKVFDTSKTAPKTFSVRHPCSSVFICGQFKCAVAPWDLSFQLTAGCENIPPSRLAHKTRHGPPHDGLKLAHPLCIRRLKRNPRPRIQRDQIYFRI